MTAQEPCSIKQAFDNAIAKHTMTIIHDDGRFNRHLHFSKGSIDQHFDLITYKGGLLIRGDMGAYVFERLDDMFVFFNQENGKINMGYWAEKLESIDRRCGLKKFSWSVFEANVLETLDDWCADLTNGVDENDLDESAKEQISELRDHVKNELENCHGDEHSAVHMINNFNYRNHHFTDFWERSCDEYSDQYIWCLYAIVWGIQQYHLELKGDAG